VVTKGRAKRVDRSIYGVDPLNPGERRRISRIAITSAPDPARDPS
jgi:hypothetical protein